MKAIKVLAGSLAAITAGATLALGIFAAPATTLGDFVKVSGNALNSPAIVVGETINPGYNMDVIGAADIAAAVAGYATTTVSSGVVGMGVSGGVEIGTTNTKLYLDDPMTKSGVKTTLTSSDLPTLLASGSMTDTGGTTYNYDQYITLGGGTTLTFGNSGGDLTDPDLILNLSTTAAAPAFNYTITFNKLLNITSSNVHSQKLNLLGTDYTIGSTSTDLTIAAAKLVLYGSSLVQTISGGEEKTITVDDVPYKVKVLGATSATTAVVSVEGTTQTVTKGTSYLISGLAVYVEDVFDLSSTDLTQDSVKLSFGTNKLTLEQGATLKKGTSDDTVDGTLVKFTGTDNTGISKLEIGIAAKSSSVDYAKQGAENAFVDPVFGRIKMALGGLSGGTTEKITIDNSGTTGASLKFTDYRNKERSLTYAYTGSTTFAADPNATSTAMFIVVENQTVKKNDYMLLSPSHESEFSHIMQYSTASSLGSSGAYIEFRDLMSDATSRFYLTDAGYGTGTLYIDGQAYYAQNVSNSLQTFAFTWGANAALNNRGDKITVFPLIKTNKGGWITLVPGNRSVLTNSEIFINQGNATLELPGGAGSATTVRIEHAAGSASGDAVLCGTTWNATASANSSGVMCDDGRLTWNITVKSGTANNKTWVTLDAGSTASLRPAYPTVLFKEEKAKNLANSDVQDFVITTVKDGTGSGVDLTIDAPTLTAATQESASLQSDNSVTSYIDRRGTTVKYDSDSQGLVEITYPDEQSVATVAIGDNPTFGTGTGGTVQAAVKITSPVAKIASEVSATAPGADLILVGGPCVNSLVAKLLGADSCSTWNYTTGIIKQVTDGFTDGSRALIVAGTQAADTRALAAKVMQGTLSYEA